MISYKEILSMVTVLGRVDLSKLMAVTMRVVSYKMKQMVMGNMKALMDSNIKGNGNKISQMVEDKPSFLMGQDIEDNS